MDYQDVLNQAQRKITNRLQELYYRWLDERKYEDFKDYEKVLRKFAVWACPKGSRVIRCQKRPFGVIVQIPGVPYYALFLATANYTQWKLVGPSWVRPVRPG